MEAETRKRIFEPFFTTKPTGSGTGLGLSIAYFIITENHAGRLTVESSPNRGTAFTVKLPLKRTP
jgi:two-component system NtrC family sensor kinase